MTAVPAVPALPYTNPASLEPLYFTILSLGLETEVSLRSWQCYSAQLRQFYGRLYCLDTLEITQEIIEKEFIIFHYHMIGIAFGVPLVPYHEDQIVLVVPAVLTITCLSYSG